MKTVKNQIMQFFANQFETRERENDETFVCLRDNAPAWCRDVCRESHSGMMPDDWRYSWISSAADTLADIDPDSWEEQTHEIADGLVDVYNGRLLAWLASNLTRAEYVNDAVSNGLVDVSGDFDLYRAIMAGQYEEIRETLETLVSEIESIADDVEPYAAGFNMCGYMPDSEPVTFPDFDSAREYILDELTEREETAEQEENDETAEQYRKAWFYVKEQKEPFTVTINHFAFWVSESENWLQDL